MSFSGTTFEQREKETKALKGFLVLSLIGSLGFHVAVLASGIGSGNGSGVPSAPASDSASPLRDALRQSRDSAPVAVFSKRAIANIL